MKMDEILYSIAEKVSNMAVVYLVDLSEVPDFNQMYELYDPVTVMFFYRNKHIMIDLGTGNNNKINWALGDKHEMIDIVETVSYLPASLLECIAYHLRKSTSLPPEAISNHLSLSLSLSAP